MSRVKNKENYFKEKIAELARDQAKQARDYRKEGSYEQAIQCIIASAGNGYVAAQWNTAVTFDNGLLDIKKDVNRAKHWYEKVASTENKWTERAKKKIKEIDNGIIL